jgi:hypothetical protein
MGWKTSGLYTKETWVNVNRPVTRCQEWQNLQCDVDLRNKYLEFQIHELLLPCLDSASCHEMMGEVRISSDSLLDGSTSLLLSLHTSQDNSLSATTVSRGYLVRGPIGTKRHRALDWIRPYPTFQAQSTPSPQRY